MIKKILLPVDGSDSCKKSWAYAKDLAEKNDGEITALKVRISYPWMAKFTENYIDETQFKEKDDRDTLRDNDQDSNNKEEANEDFASEIMEEVEEYFKGSNIKLNQRIVKGDPASEILEIAEKEDFDLIVICTHGMSALKKFAFGSVASKVVHHSEVPVMIIR